MIPYRYIYNLESIFLKNNTEVMVKERLGEEKFFLSLTTRGKTKPTQVCVLPACPLPKPTSCVFLRALCAYPQLFFPL